MLKYIYSPEYLATQLPEESFDYIERVHANKFAIKVTFKPGCATFLKGQLLSQCYFKTLVEFKEGCDPRILKLAQNALEKEFSSLDTDEEKNALMKVYNTEHKENILCDTVNELITSFSLRSGKDVGKYYFQRFYEGLSLNEQEVILNYIAYERKPKPKEDVLHRDDLMEIAKEVHQNLQKEKQEKESPKKQVFSPSEKILKEALEVMKEGLESYNLALDLLNQKLNQEIITKCLAQGREIFALKTQELINLSQKKGA